MEKLSELTARKMIDRGVVAASLDSVDEKNI